ncbi:MAG: hypothetical protein ACM3SR_07260 [Ignavibacteriales bacterium]
MSSKILFPIPDRYGHTYQSRIDVSTYSDEQRGCMEECKRIFYSSSIEEAIGRFNGWKGKWEKLASSAVCCLEKD